MPTKSNPEPANRLPVNDADPNTLPLEDEASDSKKTQAANKQQSTGGTGTIRVNG